MRKIIICFLVFHWMNKTIENNGKNGKFTKGKAEYKNSTLKLTISFSSTSIILLVFFCIFLSTGGWIVEYFLLFFSFSFTYTAHGSAECQRRHKEEVTTENSSSIREKIYLKEKKKKCWKPFFLLPHTSIWHEFYFELSTAIKVPLLFFLIWQKFFSSLSQV